MTVDTARVARILGGERTLGRRVRTLADLRRAVEAGLPVAALEKAVAHVAASPAAAAELKYRVVPKTTLYRRAAQRLTAEESERLERLARLTALAEQVWEDQVFAREFLTSTQPQLDGERPIDLLRSDLGTRQVEDLLLKLEYGLPA